MSVVADFLNHNLNMVGLVLFIFGLVVGLLMGYAHGTVMTHKRLHYSRWEEGFHKGIECSRRVDNYGTCEAQRAAIS